MVGQDAFQGEDVHDPLPGADPDVAAGQAADTVGELRRGLAGNGPDPALGLDADLRPVERGGRYLDPDAAAAAIKQVANQGK